MAEHSMFWDSENGDRLYTSDDFANLFDNILTDGWLLGVGDGFAVTDPGAGMDLQIGSGSAWIQGRAYDNDAPLTLSFAAADATHPRIDLVVLRSDYAARTITMEIMEGIPAASPAAPALTRVDGVTWELGLYSVTIAAGQLDVTTADVTDLKEDPAYCGGVEIMGFPPTIQSLLQVEADDIGAGDTLVWDGSQFVPSLLQNPATETVSDILRSIAEINASIWSLEADAFGESLEMSNWLGDAFVLGQNEVESRTVDANGYPQVGILRGASRDSGYMGQAEPDPYSVNKGNSGADNAATFGSLNGLALHPSGDWAFLQSGTNLFVHAVVGGVVSNDYVFYAMPTSTVDWAVSPDGKAILFGVSTATMTDAIEVWSFNEVTGVIGDTKVKMGVSSGTAPLDDPSDLEWSPDSNRFAIVHNTAPYIEVFEFNTDTMTFGARNVPSSNAPITNTYACCWSDDGAYLFTGGNNSGSVMDLRAFPVNTGTGVVGAGVVANDRPNIDCQELDFANGRVLAWVPSAPYVYGWTFAGGVWSASRWANPAFALVARPQRKTKHVTGSGYVVLNTGTPGNTTPGWFDISGNAFGANFNYFPDVEAGTYNQPMAHWPISHPDDVAIRSTSGVEAIYVFGDAVGTEELTGQVVFNTRQLDSDVSQVMVLHDADIPVGTTVQHDVSVDGGGLWINDVAIGEIVNVAPGSQMKLRTTITRAAVTDDVLVYWVAVWGG